jgi:GcrA cell cycle regulator
MADRIWKDEYDAFLQQCLVVGMSRAEAGAEVNARFGTKFTRNAVIGRCHRKRLQSTLKPGTNFGQVRHAPSRQCIEAGAMARRKPAQPLIQPRVIPMRCDDVEALNVPLIELRDSQCKWPVSGERAHTLFCGRLRLEASSYCPRHHDISVGRGTYSERRADQISDKVA